MDKEAGGIGKTDFSFKIRLNEEPSFGIREWIRDDVLISLWETRPRILEKKLEDETIVKEIHIDDESGKPFVDHRMRGVSSFFYSRNKITIDE